MQPSRRRFIGYSIATGLSVIGCNNDQPADIEAPSPVAQEPQSSTSAPDRSALLSAELSLRYPALHSYLADMVEIPGGSFLWGKQINQPDQPPKVTVTSFWLGRTLVTWQVWAEYCKAEQTSMPPPPDWGYKQDHPVVNVSWYDVVEGASASSFCAWVSNLTNRTFTLPTETQWEYAARGGITNDAYPWGNEWDPTKVWCSTRRYGDARSTASVLRADRTYVNSYGLVDIVGNAMQWSIDDYNGLWRPIDDDTDPVNTTSTAHKCVRGGSWSQHLPDLFRCAGRHRLQPDERHDDVGFRLCFTPS